MNPLEFPLDLTFFGLSKETAPQYRRNLFSQIHEIVFHGKGGYSWSDVYKMPTWLRKFTFHEIKTFYEKESKPSDNQAINPDGTVQNRTPFVKQNQVKSIPSNQNVPSKKPISYK